MNTPLATTPVGGSLKPVGSAPLRWWIGERCSRARKTIIVQARSRKEAQAKLDNNEGEGADVTYYDIGRAKVLREDKPNAKVSSGDES